jgi:hypothetical protein
MKGLKIINAIQNNKNKAKKINIATSHQELAAIPCA